MAEQFANNAATTLSAAIPSTSATTLTVTSASAFPSSGNFRIKIDNELMTVTGVSGTTFTVTRGAESTPAATHADGATVTHVVTAGALAALKTDTLASVPTGTYQTSGQVSDYDITGSAGNIGLSVTLTQGTWLVIANVHVTLNYSSGSGSVGTWITIDQGTGSNASFGSSATALALDYTSTPLAIVPVSSGTLTVNVVATRFGTATFNAAQVGAGYSYLLAIKLAN